VKIGLIGTGNLAFHLVRGLFKHDITFQTIFGRNRIEGELLALKFSSTYEVELNIETLGNLDLVIIAVSDSAIELVAKQISPYLNSEALVVHTSGSVPISILASYFKNVGSFYPFQTFTKLDKTLNWSDISIFLNVETQQLTDLILQKKYLLRIASTLSEKIFWLKDEDRMFLHIAAIFAHNFSNNFWRIASEILKSKNLDFSVVMPILKQALAKTDVMSPQQAQTGPAIRGDEAVVEKHYHLLQQNFPEFAELYKINSLSINKDLTL